MERLAARIILLWGWQRALAAFASGGLAVAALAPFDFPAVGFVSFTVLVWLLDGATGVPQAGFLGRLKPAFATGWWFGFGYFIFGLWWIGNALLVEADSFAWALPLAIIVLPGCMAVFYGLAGALSRIWWREGPSRIAVLAVMFAVCELMREHLFTGFPWNPVGFTIAPVPVLMQSASVIGISGLNGLAVLIYAMPAILISKRFVKTGVFAATILAFAHTGFGLVRTAIPPEIAADQLVVRIVQPSIKQTEKWDEEQRSAIFDLLIELTGKPYGPEAKPADLVVWPETAIPFLLTERPSALSAIGNLLGARQMLLTGAVRVEGDRSSPTSARFYNSIIAINGDGEIVDAADKLHLVPFGEYLPFSEALSELGLSRLVEGPGTFSPGASMTTLALPGGLKALPFVCYEIIFSNTLPSADDVSVVINVTNDAWYGKTPGPYQHLRHAQLRAVELGLPVIRAANNGISAVIDSHGNIIDALDLDVRGNLDVNLAVAPIGTLYQASQGFYGYFLLAGMLIFGILTGFSRRLRSN